MRSVASQVALSRESWASATAISFLLFFPVRRSCIDDTGTMSSIDLSEAMD